MRDFADKKERDEAYRALFNSGIGKLVLEDMKKELLFARNLYNDGKPKEDLHYYMGRQSVINDIVFLITNDKG